MSEKRLLGWEPTEVHAHEYDDAGRLVRTVVTRESEWDDLEREKMLALEQYESEICSCGFHVSVADRDPHLETTVRKCPVCAGLAVNARVIAAEDKKQIEALGKSPDPLTPRPDDGRHFGLRAKVSPELERILAEISASVDRGSESTPG